MNGPDTWCYDALELPRVFASGLGAKTILRTLEVIETEFDTNPAVHATILYSRVPIETYLATAPDDDIVAMYLRTHRTPGATTLLQIESDKRISTWTVDGLAPDALPLAIPGDHAAGVIDETAQMPAQYRTIVSPGRHILRCERENAAPYERTIEIEPGVACTIVIG